MQRGNTEVEVTDEPDPILEPPLEEEPHHVVETLDSPLEIAAANDPAPSVAPVIEPSSDTYSRSIDWAQSHQINEN